MLALRSRCSQDGGSQTLTFLVGDIACAEDFSVAATRWLLRPEACCVRPSRPCRRANEAAPLPVQQLRSLYQMNIFRHLHSQHSSMKSVEVVGDFEVNVALGLAHTEPGLSSGMTVAGQGSLHSVL